MPVNLKKGQKVSLSKENPGLSRVVVGLGWDEVKKPKGLNFLAPKPAPIDCDASAILLHEGKLVYKEDVVYFGNLRHPTGTVQHMGDNLTGAGEGDDEQIIVVLAAIPAEYDKIRSIAKRYNMLILEDAAQAFGGCIGERRTCSFGDISTTSFFPAKPLGCYGDGGAVFTDNDEWAQILRSLHVHGKGKDKYDNIRIGLNSRLDTLQAAVLLAKMDFLEEELKRCDQIAAEYTRRLAGAVKTPVILEGMRCAWAQYTICVDSKEEREHLMAALKEAGIPTAVYYKKPMHLQQAFAGHLIEAVPCVRTEEICQRCVSLPMHPYLEEEQIEAVCGQVLNLRK